MSGFRLLVAELKLDREAECAASPWLTLDPDASTHALHDVTADGQSQSSASIGFDNSLVGLLERFEDPRLGLRADSHARVDDGELQLRALGEVAHLLNGDGDAPMIGELDRAGEQIGENLLEPPRVATELQRAVAGSPELNAHTLFF